MAKKIEEKKVEKKKEKEKALSGNPRDFTPAQRRAAFAKYKATLKSDDFRVLHSDQVEEFIPYGLVALDGQLRLKGLPRRGRLIQIHGPEHSNKSTLGYAILRNYQKQMQEPVAIFDHELTLNNEYLTSLGVDLDLLIVRTPVSVEDAAQHAIELMETGVRVFMFDSIPKMKPKAERADIMSGKSFKPTVGVHARAIQQFMDIIIPYGFEHNCTLIFINQTRSRIDNSREAQSAAKYPTFWNLDYSLPGGRSSRYNMSVMIETKISKGYRPSIDSKTEWLVPPSLNPKENSKEPFLATEIKVRALKNKVNGGGYRAGSIWHKPNRGIDDNISIRQLARHYKLIDYSGKTWFVGESKDDAIITYNTKAEAIQDLVIDENPEVLAELRKMVMKRLELDDQSFLTEVSADMINYMSGENTDFDAAEGEVYGNKTLEEVFDIKPEDNEETEEGQEL